jgi:hypothetical protein
MIDAYVLEERSPNFVEEGGLPTEMDRFDNDLRNLSEKVDELMENYKWFQADETQSKLGNAELKVKEISQEIEEIIKKINVLTSVSKLFKGHINNRDIHLQD